MARSITVNIIKTENRDGVNSSGLVKLSYLIIIVLIKKKHALTDGKSYVGNWLNGKQHGKGTLKHQDGKTVEGIWEDGKKKQPTVQ